MTMFRVGDVVRIREGASAWMREIGYWCAAWPQSIDGMMGVIINDYTHLSGSDAHFEVQIDGVDGCGVNPQWLTPAEERR